MIIPVNDQWRITLDSYCWTIEKYRCNKKKPEKSGWRPWKHYRTLSQACERLLTESLLTTEAHTLGQWREAHEEALTAISDAVQACPVPDSWLDAKQTGEIAHD
jgi:hypothetical protein